MSCKIEKQWECQIHGRTVLRLEFQCGQLPENIPLSVIADMIAYHGQHVGKELIEAAVQHHNELVHLVP
jgi:hypothetical protein